MEPITFFLLGIASLIGTEIVFLLLNKLNFGFADFIDIFMGKMLSFFIVLLFGFGFYYIPAEVISVVGIFIIIIALTRINQIWLNREYKKRKRK